MSGWRDIKTAPYQKVVWVKNDLMDEPVMATRGFNTEIGVHPDNTFFTTVYTPHKFFPTFAGNLCCPNKWRPLDGDSVAPTQELAECVPDGARDA